VYEIGVKEMIKAWKNWVTRVGFGTGYSPVCIKE
jgi:hypothetical protein